MNVVNLLGNITKDPVVNETKSGMLVANFSLAINSVSKGEKETLFVNCTAFNKTAEIMEKYVKKGMPLAVRGRLRPNEYENKEGVSVREFVVFVDEIFLIKTGEKARERDAEDDSGGGYSAQRPRSGGAYTREQEPRTQREAKRSAGRRSYGEDSFSGGEDDIAF